VSEIVNSDAPEEKTVIDQTEAAATSSSPPDDEAPPGGRIDRRAFLRATGLGAGSLALAGPMGGLLTGCADRGPSTPQPGRGRDVVVIGAGAFGVWTAFHLQELGARVTLVDLYGPGNSRATSGDETRGIRSSYQGRELWTSWAVRAIERWEAFDEEWAPSLGSPLFYRTGDLIFRESREGMIDGVMDLWTQIGREHELLTVDEARYRWPQFDLEGIGVALYEPGAGVARARAACRRVAHIFGMRGGEIVLGRAAPGASQGGRLQEITLDGGDRTLGADLFVFALGPWFPSAFPEIMGEVIRIPMGNVIYYGTPPGDRRFEFPNLPSWGFSGVTGWPALPPDYRGFRVRTGGQSGENPDVSNRWVPESGLERPRAVLQQRFPAMAEQPVVETRACHYESSTTRDWIIDLHPDYENAWFAGGGNAEGFKFGPMLGELIASRVLDTGLHADLDARFRLDPPEEPAEPSAAASRIDDTARTEYAG
jgi:sarcosine oxidase